MFTEVKFEIHGVHERSKTKMIKSYFFIKLALKSIKFNKETDTVRCIVLNYGDGNGLEIKFTNDPSAISERVEKTLTC